MAKTKVAFVCNECGQDYPKWQGRCSACGSWNSLSEFRESAKASISESNSVKIKNIQSLMKGKDKPQTFQSKVKRLQEVSIGTETRYSTGLGELDLVLGGGLVKGSLVLVGGDPGIGKSTLLLQTAENLACSGKRVLYVSGEESIRQTKLRAKRLGANSEELLILTENDLEIIKEAIIDTRPDVLIVDSVQTVHLPGIESAPGSITQVRESTNQFMSIAKGAGISTFLVGHVTKTGSIAGPKMLEHMVDTVLYFEGDTHKLFRILRAVKNRFGSTNEIGVFEMTGGGLAPVENPSKLFLSGQSLNEPGSVIIATVEGSRTLLVELQCLVSDSNFSNPRRMAVGVDYNKLVLLIAVLEKKVGFPLYSSDVYLNIVGGVDISEPAVDLAIIMAVASSLKGITVPRDMVIMGEVGLTGEIRAINHIQQRINEAYRMGFTKAIIPHANLETVERPEGFTVIGLKNIADMIKYFL